MEFKASSIIFSSALVTTKTSKLRSNFSCSKSSAGGTDFTTSPNSSRAFITIYDRADFKRHVSDKETVICTPRKPLSCACFIISLSLSLKANPDSAAGASATGAAAAGAAGAAAEAALDADSPFNMALNFATNSETSIKSSGSPLATLSIICSKESKHLNKTSMISSVIFNCSLRRRSRTSSISCVSSAILL